MTSISISLPENLKEFIVAQVATRGYSTPSEYICELIREDQKKKLAQRLSLLLLEGLESSQPLPAGTAYWNAKRQTLAAES
jgi:antitoxin ParD1/3/4